MTTTDTATGTTRADMTAPVSDTAPDTDDTTRHDRVRWPRRWPLAMLAAPAGVATWSGWVGLGGLTGFGKVHPLPGIADSFAINSAITLPIGVEAYAAYAMAAWLTSAPVSDATRKFARRSAIGALVLGMLGQVAYHLLVSGHKTHAPWLITTAVACLPVLVLGAGASLAHMLHRDRAAVSNTVENTATDTAVDTAPAGPEPVPDTALTRVEDTTRPVSNTAQSTVPDTTGPVPDTTPTRVENTAPDTTQNTTRPVFGSSENTVTDTPDTAQNTSATRPRRTPTRRTDTAERSDRNTVARRIYDEHVAEHDEAPAVAELMRRLKAAGYPTGNRTAAALLNDMREHPLRLAQ